MKIGYVGLNSSHALNFSKMINVDRPAGLPEGRITHIWGKDPERAAELIEKCQIDTACPTLESMVDRVDAVIIGARAGARHLDEARPFLEAGMRVFVDKPFTNDLADAEELLELADKHGAAVDSFSGLRVVPEVVDFKSRYAAATTDRYGGAINGHGDSANPYGGWYFYGVHAIELLLEVWGLQDGEVLAAEIGPHLHMRFALATGEVVSILLTPKWPPWSLSGYIDHGTVQTIVPLGGMQIEVTRSVLAFLHGEEGRSHRELLAPLKVIEAVRESLEDNASAAFEL